MVKQGGTTANQNPSHSRHMPRNHRCKYCGRAYAQEWTKRTHEMECCKFHDK